MLALALSLSLSLKSADPTQHHQSRYPKSRLFGYLPDLPYVISCMNPVVMMMRSSPTSPRLYPAVQAHSIAEDPSQAKLQRWVLIGRQLLHKPRDALGSAACGAAGRCPWSRVHSNATRIGARTCAESIGFSRRPNPLPPKQVPKKSTRRPDLC